MYPKTANRVHIHNLPQEASPKIGIASFFISFLDFFLILFEKCLHNSKSVRVSEEAKARLEAFCAANGCSKSDGIEKMLLNL